MSKLYLSLAFSLCVISGYSQNVANPSFEEHYIGAIDRVFDWVTSDGFRFAAGHIGDTILPLEANTTYNAEGFLFSEVVFGLNLDSDAQFSTTAIRLKTQPQTYDTSGAYFPTFLTNGTHVHTDESGYLDFSAGGVPFPRRPTHLAGYYRLHDTLSAIDHFGRCRILLKKFNATTQISDTIAYSDSQLDLSPSLEWKPFSIPISYRSELIPDSIVIVFNPSIFPDEPAELWLDELAFVYTPTSSDTHDLNPDAPKIYPNPVQDLIYIDPKQRDFHSFRLLDVSGRLLQQGPFERRIDLSVFSQQSFILQLVPSEGRSMSFYIVRSTR